MAIHSLRWGDSLSTICSLLPCLIHALHLDLDGEATGKDAPWRQTHKAENLLGKPDRFLTPLETPQLN